MTPGSLPVVGATVIALVAGVVGTAAANPHTDGKTVSYLGMNFTVPASWPVINVSPGSCVRFDRHAVYLGTPGTRQNCPAHATGATEAIMVQPAHNPTTTATDNTTSHRITVQAPTVSITASYATDRATVDAVLASAGLPKPTVVTPKPARNQALLASVPVDATNFTGNGFDTCVAPSTSAMAAWKGSSPYSAIGIYIGGSNRICAQPSYFNAAWVTTEYNAGWRFLPIYAGFQATTNQADTVTEGTQQADDAVVQAQGLGFPAGSVLYYNMEDYAPQFRGAAMAFEAAWTAEVHKDGYFAGLYSSANSGIADVVDHADGLATPDVVDDGNWNGIQGTGDTEIGLPAGYWINHQRVHQYNHLGNQTYNNVTIDIDGDSVDILVAGTPVPIVRSAYQATTPQRLLDTRSTGPVGADSTIRLGLTGVPSSVSSVVLNVTAVGPTANSYLSVFPDGVPLPNASSLNFTPNETISNLVTVPVYDGSVTFYNHVGSTHILADLFGYYSPGTPSQYHALTPSRLVDTRSRGARLGGNSSMNVTVSGMAGIPSGVTAVIMNLTAVNPTANSYLTAYAGGTALPSVSNVNFAAGQTVPNLAIVPVNNGVITVYNHVGSVDVVGDVFGYFDGGAAHQFTPTSPVRLLDTRGTAPIGQGGLVTLPVAGVAGVPSDVEAVVLNVTAVAPTDNSYLTVYPDGQPLPTVSNLNYAAGETIANQVIVPVSNGAIDFYNHVGSVDVTADIAGYFAG